MRGRKKNGYPDAHVERKVEKFTKMHPTISINTDQFMMNLYIYITLFQGSYIKTNVKAIGSLTEAGDDSKEVNR